MNITITPGRLEGAITPPPSKSQAHRLIIAACLAGGESRVKNLAESQDILATRACMAVLKRHVPQGDKLPLLDCGESGSTLRFLIPLALVLCGGGIFTGRGRLMERPQEPYFELFREKSIFYEQKDGLLTVRGALTPGLYSLRGDVSSQFITGLLYALPLLTGDSEIRLTTPLESRSYVDMTLDALERFGVNLRQNGMGGFSVTGGQHYRPINCAVEADWSQAGFYYAAAGIGNNLTVTGMNPNSRQGDKIIADYACRLSGPGTVTLDVSDCPDLVPALALIAALRGGGTTRIINATRLRLKESDRLDTVASELCKLGADVEQGADFLTIRGVSALTGGTVDSHNDHRIAMMLAIAATRCTEKVTILDAGSVAKSYPNFWEDYAALGGVFTVTEERATTDRLRPKE